MFRSVGQIFGQPNSLCWILSLGRATKRQTEGYRKVWRLRALLTSVAFSKHTYWNGHWLLNHLLGMNQWPVPFPYHLTMSGVSTRLRIYAEGETAVRRRKSCNRGMQLRIFQRSYLFKKLRTPEVVAWNSVSFGQGCENKSLWGLTPPTSVGVVDDFVRRGGDRQQRIWDIPRGRQFPTTYVQPTMLFRWPPSLGRIKYLSFILTSM